MRLVDVIEICSISQTPDEVIWQIAKTYTPEDIDKLILIFLRGIDTKHQVNGKIIYDLSDISNKYKEFGDMTNEQRIYVLGRIIANWHQMSCESRALLNL